MTALQDHVQNAVNHIIQEQQITDYEIEITPGSNAGDNYGSTIHRIRINGKKNGFDTTLSLICKIPVVSSDSQTLGFDREIIVYKNILKELKKFQQEKNVCFDNGFNSAVTCYAADNTKGKEYLIMEDLKPQNFTILDRDTNLDLEHIQFIVRELAKFHAFSFALKDQKPEVFERISNLPEVLLQNIGEKAFFNMCECGLKRALKLCDEKYKTSIENLLGRYPDIMVNCIHGKGSEDHLVITHADCWKNNVMFKYENGSPVEIRMFDWQITRLSSPAMDLVYIFYNSANDEVIQQHFDTIIHIYYEQLKKSTTSLGSDITQLYPRSVLDNDLKTCSLFGIIFNIFGLNIFYADTPPQVNELFTKAGERSSKEECFSELNEEAKKKFGGKVNVMIEQALSKGFL